MNIYTHIHVCNNNENKAMNFKESKEGFMGRFRERKGNIIIL